MQLTARMTSFSPEAPVSDRLEALDRIIADTEQAELELASVGGIDAREQRKSSGSFYTPADVAEHFWSLFFRHHRLGSAEALKAFIGRTHLVEPSAGSGIFVFSFIRKALALGLTPGEVAGVRFHVIDINLAALSFFKRKLKQLEGALSVRFEGIGCDQIDFLDWANAASFPTIAFVGNPPFVGNARGSRWRNLYADFLEAMLRFKATEKAISLIVPVSICFSRDYADLRRIVDASGLGLSASSYDNIPDCLFKSGKPESLNSNRANSQRCTILNLGGPDPARREAAPLQRWTAREREQVLGGIPAFHRFGPADGFLGQIPRPESQRIMSYLAQTDQAQPVRSMLSRSSKPAFALGGVARNFIGIRDIGEGASGMIPIRPAAEQDMLMLLQVFASGIFFDYWRTLGDGFHVTKELVEQFPITPALRRTCERNLVTARSVWQDRGAYAKEKLNSGKRVRSYDFSGAFGPSLR